MTTVAEFAELLNKTMGLSADTVGLPFIASALSKRLSACRLKNLDEYWTHLIACESEMGKLIDAVVVPETWFFRDDQAFAALAQAALRKYLPEHSLRPMRLLSLPCATGEEPYSMAMALLAAGLPANQFHIDAIDISEDLLQRARAAVYGRNSFRGKSLAFRERYFEPAGSDFRLEATVRDQVSFHHGNLLDPGFRPESTTYDFIFCRNVLIYFDRETQDRAVNMLTRLLQPDALLFTGPSESGLLLQHDFVSAKLPQAFAFSKKLLPPVEIRGAKLADPVAPHPPRKVATRSLLAGNAAIKPKAVSRPKPLLGPVLGKTAATGLEEMTRLADKGRLGEAILRGEEFLRSHGPSAQAYHLMGLAHSATGLPEEAEKYYRKALYLDPEHHEALLHLALLLESKGDAAAAQRLQQRAKRVGGAAL